MAAAVDSWANMVQVIVEDKPSAVKMLRRRAKRLGVHKAIGQALFVAYSRRLERQTSQRKQELMSDLEVKVKPFPTDRTLRVTSINDDSVIAALKRHRPDVVVVFGTRIISSRVLSSIDAPFINTHMGITPRYRGVHGGYWALAKGDRENCGVTVHLVDEGIDTGGVLHQQVIEPSDADNFFTYPALQLDAALPLLKAALHDVEHDQIRPNAGVGPSQLWHHPTIFEYLATRVRHKVA